MLTSRKRKSAEPLPEIPAWFTTFSDVITLLITFFILLLTFSTTEPEEFQQIQSTLFSDSNSNGVVGEKSKKLSQDSIVYRRRPPSARLAIRGSEMPPTRTQPQTQFPAGFLGGLDTDEFLDLADKYSVEVDLYALVSRKGQLFPRGQQQARMLAIQMLQLPMHITFEVPTEAALDRVLALTQHLFKEYRVKPGQMGVRLDDRVPPHRLRIVIQHHLYDRGGEMGR